MRRKSRKLEANKRIRKLTKRKHAVDIFEVIFGDLIALFDFYVASSVSDGFNHAISNFYVNLRRLLPSRNKKKVRK